MSTSMMSERPVVRILESAANKRGDLFGRLMADVFLALGYENVRLNIHKSGREIDLVANHRTEARHVVAECKATADTTGGDDVNKFVGSLDAERRKHLEGETVGYFISLSGFTETAIEQELDLGNKRVILLNGAEAVEQLITGRVIVSERKAVELAGRCVGTGMAGLSLEPRLELLAHEIGWIWAIYFSKNQELSSFSLVHADGNFIGQKAARTIIEADKAIGGEMHSLHYLAPSSEPGLSEVAVAKARDHYLRFLEQECGEIHLDGLPADQEVGGRRLRLETLFVPLRLVNSIRAEQTAGQEDNRDENVFRSSRGIRRRPLGEKDDNSVTVGKALSQTSRMTILGLPGGGKTTLLKRLATAYAFPERRSLVGDELPPRDWLPLLIRCRQLGALVRSPITEILAEIPLRAEMSNELAECFRTLTFANLRDGAALLLIDGLDEIANGGDRVAFVHQLRTFLATYPNAALVLTSREAGFRLIGGALRTLCQHFTLDDLDEDEIRTLTLNWHKEVVGDTAHVHSEAEKLAQTIVSNERLFELASNPLLLTTLLLVKRWVGQLPTKRTVLYGKAIEVLLMTWNVESYDPIDQEEAIPQLGYVAFWMMCAGTQRISVKRLRELLNKARTEMPEILGCARNSVSEFIDRVELRSSLLILSGHMEDDGGIFPAYEFRHLTFQEYLAAHAIVNGHYSGRDEADDLVTVLKPHMDDGRWSEVVPLASVLAGRRVQPLIIHMIDEYNRAVQSGKLFGPYSVHVFDDSNPGTLLAACLGDEIQAPPELLKSAMKCAIHAPARTSARQIASAKYGVMLYEVGREEFRNSTTDLMNIGGNLFEMSGPLSVLDLSRSRAEQTAEPVDRMLRSDDPVPSVPTSLRPF